MRTPFLAAVLSAALAFPAFATAQTAGTETDVQIRSINFATQTLELHNFGSTSRPLDGWRFCTHDEAVGFRYTSTSGLNGQTVAAGESLFIDWDNNGSGSNTINVNTLGGSWIDDLFADAIGEAVQIGIYHSPGFSTASSLADHIQYSFNGADVNGADIRGGPAETAELWSDRDDWISVDANSTGILLNANPFPGAGASHGPTSFSITAVPEPSALVVLAFGIVGVAARRRRNPVLTK